MNNMLDIVGSFIIGSLIILMVGNLNLQISATHRDNFYGSISQVEVVNAATVLESDFEKIGYKSTSSNKIILADTSAIQFYSDYDDDQTVEQVKYRIGSTSALSGTQNPNDRPIYRQIDDGQSMLIGAAKYLKFVYYDSLGNQISYQALTGQSSRNIVKMIQVNLIYESPFLIDGNYQTTQWKKTFNPKNLN
ncbi:MAG: hypothetical protein HYZ10_11985 [Ignavibacteriales bacterium]|nr:hypothetical protein [Ignavibacteriales bacterium]OGV16771.1 MAG: hypothetical protein A2440_05360 [Stygiobacter sp. RIFOXYC2_FULL_38_25]OGV18128.1 MAG: hypothetical protein A2237_06335 [Stygiobacter sp. RIFOXYA2_FULL_38_8]